MKRISTVVLASGVGLVGVMSTAVGAPAMAATISGEARPGQAVSDRVTALKSALSGLVSDGTLTQDQADKVASTLNAKLPERRHDGLRPSDKRPGGMRHGFTAGLQETSVALGITSEELRAALREGESLKALAEEKGLATADLIDKLVTATESRLDEAVTAGRMTQAQADAIKPQLKERITTLVEEGFAGHRGPRADRRGEGGQGGPGGLTD